MSTPHHPNQHRPAYGYEHAHYDDNGDAGVPTALTTDQEADPNLVSPWGTYTMQPAPQHEAQQQQHHHHEHHGSAYEAQGFHDVPIQEQQQQPQALPRPVLMRLHSSSKSSRPGSLDLDLETEKAMLRQHRMSRLNTLATGTAGSTGSTRSHTAAHNMNRELSDFDIANGRIGKRLLANKAHIAQHGEQIPITWSHLFKRPLIRQWLHHGKLYREEDEREPSRFELFFDLSFVGIVHLLADAAAESATAINVAKFVLTFHPAWSIWLDVRQFINISGTDDVWQRIYVLLMMLLLAGYAANATGIKIENFGTLAHAAQLAGELTGGLGEGGGGEHGEAGGEGSGSGSGSALEELGAALTGSSPKNGGGSSGSDHSASGGGASEHARRVLVNHVGPWILKRASGAAAAAGGEGHGAGTADEAELPPLDNYIGNGYYFLEGYDSALRSAIAFFLVAKAIRLALYLIYGALLPKFRKALWLNGLSLALIAAINIPLILVTNTKLIIFLWTAGIAVEILSRYFIAMGLQIMHARQKHRGQTSYIPAASIEHIMERMVLFTILIIGEAILVANYSSTAGTYGLSTEYGRSALAITLAFLTCWLMFDADAARTFVHALRRNWFTSISFSTIHFPLCASLILMASALHHLVTHDEVERGYLWLFSGSLATTVGCIAGIGLLHKPLDRHGSALMPHHLRILWRLMAALVIACLPIHEHWSSIAFLAVNVAILAWLVAFETIGKVGAVGKRYDEKKAEELKAARAALYVDQRGGAVAGKGQGAPGQGVGGGPASKRPGTVRASLDPNASTYSMHALVEKPGPVGMSRGSSSTTGGGGANSTNTSTTAAGAGAAAHPYPSANTSSSLRDRLFYRMRRLNKDWTVRAPRRASWHEYEDLTGAERGEEDVGIESELGRLQVKEVSSGQRWAYAV